MTRGPILLMALIIGAAASGLLLAPNQLVTPAAAARDAAQNGIVEVAPGSAAEREIRLTPAGRMRLGELISATALVEPDARQVAHIGAPIAARVVKLVADPGQEVKPGEPLAILSSVELGQAKAEYLKARSLREIAEKNLEREERLYQQKIASMKDLLDARAAHATALAQYRASREGLRLLIPHANLDAPGLGIEGQPLGEFALTSPIAGTLVRRDLTLGAMVERNKDVMTVMNLDHVWVLANVFEHDLAGLALGQRAEVSVDAYPEDRFTGVVAHISDVLDRTTRTVQARIVVPNPSRRLKPGMFARVGISGSRHGAEALCIPVSALYDLEGTKAVFVAAGPHRFAMKPVKVGRQGEDWVEVLSGVSEGERVVSDGGLVLKALFLNRGGE